MVQNLVQIWVQIWILFGIFRILQHNVVMWEKAAFSHWPLGPLLFPPLTPSSTARCLVNACGSLCLCIQILSTVSRKQPLFGHLLGWGMCVWVGQSTLTRANPGRRSMWALEKGLRSFGQGICRYLECCPERNRGCGRGGLDPSLHGTQPEEGLPKHRAQSMGHQYIDISVSSAYKLHEGRDGFSQIY